MQPECLPGHWPGKHRQGIQPLNTLNEKET